MKNTFFQIFILLLFSSCSANETEVEEVLLQCLTSKYLDNDVVLSTELEKLEAYLVEREYLKSADGNGYILFFAEMAKLNDCPATINWDDFEGLYKVEPSEYYDSTCIAGLQTIDTNNIIATPFFKLAKKIETLKMTEEVSVAKISKVYLETFKPADFDNDFYRYTSLLAIAYTANPSDGGITIKRRKKKTPKYTSSNELVIDTYINDTLKINGLVSSLDQLEFTINAFLIEHKSDHSIVINTNSGVSYDFYTRVQDVIIGCYQHVRNIESLKKFEQEYKSLSGEKRDEIREIIPQNLVEN